MKEKDLPLPIPNNKEDLELWLEFAGPDKFGVDNIVKAIENIPPTPTMGRVYRKAYSALLDNDPPQNKAELLNLLGVLDRCFVRPETQMEKNVYDGAGKWFMLSALTSHSGAWVESLLIHFPDKFSHVATEHHRQVGELIQAGQLGKQAQDVLFETVAQTLAKMNNDHNPWDWRTGGSLRTLDLLLGSNPGAIDKLGKTQQKKLACLFEEFSGRYDLVEGERAFEMQSIREKRRRLDKQATKIRIKRRAEKTNPAKPGPRM